MDGLQSFGGEGRGGLFNSYTGEESGITLIICHSLCVRDDGFNSCLHQSAVWAGRDDIILQTGLPGRPYKSSLLIPSGSNSRVLCRTGW